MLPIVLTCLVLSCHHASGYYINPLNFPSSYHLYLTALPHAIPVPSTSQKEQVNRQVYSQNVLGLPLAVRSYLSNIESPITTAASPRAIPSPSISNKEQVDWQVYSQKVLGLPLAVTSSLSDIESPTTRAALFYLESTLGKEETSCAKVAKVYIETLLAGGSPAQANAEAAAVFIRNYNEGSRHMPGSPCEAADNAFRNAAESGEDPVLAAAQAFMQSYKSDSPCFVAAKDYMQTVGKGFSSSNAYLSAAKSFGRQIQTLASQGKTTIDPICAEAALSYTSATSTSSSPKALAMSAFISKAVETGKGFDPVCYKAAEAFIGSDELGRSELASTFAAARSFLKIYKSNPAPASDSPCAAATKAYVSALKKSEQSSTVKALFAFVDEALLSNDDGLDPVCGEAAEAYFDSFLNGVGEDAAIEAAAIAYIDAVGRHPEFNSNSPCGRAAQAYIDVL